MPAPQVSTGISFSFATSGFTANFINVTPPAWTREALETSHMQTVNWKTYIPSKLADPGGLDAVIQFDPGNAPPILDDPEVITITFADGEQWAFTGFMTNFTPAADLETVMQATCTFKASGGPTITPAP